MQTHVTRYLSFSFYLPGQVKEIHVARSALEHSLILLGIDTLKARRRVHQQLAGILAGRARATNVTGSCALGLGLVAAGVAGALVQSIQEPWDWAAGKVIVEEAGGVMLFYEMNTNVLPNVNS